MKVHRLFLYSLLLFFAWLVADGSMVFAGDEHAKVVDGIAIYLGVVPCELIQGQERQMHGGVPKILHCHHVMVALFDDASGKRIENATVTARVREPGVSGVSGVEKPLEPMPIAGAMTYGNFFPISAPGEFLIDLKITRPGSPHVTKTEFQREHIMH
jgi:hypothetical protein